MVPQLAPPKIPEGERVDFDVSARIKVSCCRLDMEAKTRIAHFLAISVKLIAMRRHR